ncbi:phage tail protein [Chryseobacterium balustinum]|uniref:phage tail protein n=1 Tax=Chryseobacterium balustinum TaxID=246 RepID=UPI003CF262B6
MNNIILYRNNSPLFNLVERGKRSVESAAISKALLSDDTLTIRMKSSSVLDIKINDYFVLFGSVYRLNALPNVNKISDTEHEYDIIAEGLMYDMKRCKYFNADGTGQKFNLEFPLIGTIETFLICLKNNMQRLSLDWEIGNFTNAETKTITFGDDSCLSALQKICDEFKTDFWIKIENDKIVIHTGDFGRKLPLTFEYGKGKGLYGLNRSNVDDNDIINRLYVLGGTENIPNGYRNFSTNLLLPNSDFIEDQNLIAGFGLKEGSITFDDIYPKRTGKITALGDTKFKFLDSGMDFDLNAKEADNVTTKYLIAGTSAKVHFNTGNLAGYEFEIKKGGYSHASKEFEIIPFTNDSGQKFPDVDSEAFQFALDDEYVILDIVMPDSYINNAENELLVKGLEQFELHKNAKVSYDLEIDPAYMEKIGIGNFDIGDYVTVVDKPLGINKMLRINSTTVTFIENGVYNPFKYKVVIADSYEINYASQVILDVKTIKNVLSITNLGNINYSKLGLKTTQELQNLAFDTDGYFWPENIKPESIETNMLSVGAKSQQVSCSVVFELMVDGNKNKVKANAGVIYSQTFDKTWNIAENNITLPDDGFRYVYAVCDKSGTDAVIEFTQDKIKFDDDVNDFYFLLGILHTVVDDVRVLSITIGTTTINGGLIRTGTISSLDMQTYFNLDTGEIKGKIKFLNGSDGFTSIDGGLLMSQIIEVGDDTERNAFISSITDDGDESIRIGAGAPYSDKNNAPFRVLDNGKMIAENAEIIGKINATEGYIGGVNGWKITATTLTSTLGKLLFGEFNSAGELISGISISSDNYPGNPTWRNRFRIFSNTNESNVFNLAADISATGTGVNTALRLNATGSTVGNVALEIMSGGITIGSQTGKSAYIQYKDNSGNNKGMQFVNGILVEISN